MCSNRQNKPKIVEKMKKTQNKSCSMIRRCNPQGDAPLCGFTVDGIPVLATDNVLKLEEMKTVKMVTDHRSARKYMNSNGKFIAFSPLRCSRVSLDKIQSPDNLIKTLCSLSSDFAVEKHLNKSKDVATTTDTGFSNMKIDKTTSTCDLTLHSEACCQTESFSAPVALQSNEISAAVNIASPLPDFFELDQYLHDNGKESVLLDISNSTCMPSSLAIGNDDNDAMKSQLKLKFMNDLHNCVVFDIAGNLPIHVAVLKNNTLDVKRQCLILKARQLNVNVPNSNGLTPLQLAILNSVDPQIIAVLLENGSKISVMDSGGNNIIHLAVMYSQNFQDIVLAYLMNVARRIKFDINLFNYEGCTALIICTMQRKKEMANILLENGADPNIRDQKSGRTALFHAIENNDLEMVELLLKFKANQKVRNFFGTSPHDAMFELESVRREIKELVLGKELSQIKYKPSPPEKKRRKVKQESDSISVATGDGEIVNLSIVTPALIEYTAPVVKHTYQGKKLKIIRTHKKVNF